jgi:hypothetical protein
MSAVVAGVFFGREGLGALVVGVCGAFAVARFLLLFVGVWAAAGGVALTSVVVVAGSVYVAVMA